MPLPRTGSDRCAPRLLSLLLDPLPRGRSLRKSHIRGNSPEKRIREGEKVKRKLSAGQMEKPQERTRLTGFPSEENGDRLLGPGLRHPENFHVFSRPETSPFYGFRGRVRTTGHRLRTRARLPVHCETHKAETKNRINGGEKLKITFG